MSTNIQYVYCTHYGEIYGGENGGFHIDANGLHKAVMNRVSNGKKDVFRLAVLNQSVVKEAIQ